MYLKLIHAVVRLRSLIKPSISAGVGLWLDCDSTALLQDWASIHGDRLCAPDPTYYLTICNNNNINSILFVFFNYTSQIDC